MRKVQVVLYNDGNRDRQNRFQALMSRKPHQALAAWSSCDNNNIAPCFTKTANGLQFEVVPAPSYVFYAELSNGNYFLYRIASGNLSDQQIIQLIQEASGAKVNFTPAPGQSGGLPENERKEGTGTNDGGNGEGTGGPGCLLPLWLTGGKCIRLPAWIWLLPAAYTGVKIIDARKNSGRIIWGSASGYFLYRYLKDLNRK